VREISAAFGRPWSVRLPLLTRQMNTQYVDAFFTDGSLRLSSFETFRRHPDEVRRDEQEGLVAMEIEAPNGTLNLLGANAQEAYILCASTIETTPATNPNDDHSAFRILDCLAFADAISRQIPGFVGGVEGLCSYRDNTMIRKKDARLINPPEKAEDAERWFAEQQSYVGKQVIDAYFMKHSRFSSESEYRFIWFAEGMRHEFLDIKCPAALKFCARA
jgi:hypothetical protein